MKTMFSIGEFSRVTGLSVKTLRFYHEKGIVLPSSVDDGTGYRFYDSDKIEIARVIKRLREMEFSIEDIASVLGECGDEADILDYLERHKTKLRDRIQSDRDIVRSLDAILSTEYTARRMLAAGTFEVEEKTLQPMIVAGSRMKGRYSECGKGFSRLGKALGRHLCGKPLCLYYDGEYREEDADFEPCFPIRKEVSVPGISVRHLPGGRCVALVHRGPYDQLGRSYAKLFDHLGDQGREVCLPTREVYLKGPGMLFKGNPKNYLTEIQLPLAD